MDLTGPELLEHAPIALAEVTPAGALGRTSARFRALPGAAAAVEARLVAPPDVEGDRSGTATIEVRILEVTLGPAPAGGQLAIVRDVTEEATDRAAWIAAEHARLHHEQRIALATHDLRGAVTALMTWVSLLRACMTGIRSAPPDGVLEALFKGASEVAAIGARLQALTHVAPAR